MNSYENSRRFFTLLSISIGSTVLDGDLTLVGLPFSELDRESRSQMRELRRRRSNNRSTYHVRMLVVALGSTVRSESRGAPARAL